MHWSSVSEFIAMGGYAMYVWGSFLACVLLIVLEVYVLTVKNNKVMALVAQHGGDDA